ncbi:glycerophosphodiester phosphodiesterase [Candidatus Poriferisodalis sp.]|uniref:glycerophosphodiester phosphodiesterase n=1 Tax=Candidatus Poriferisodalis sp. TaxID=3101277 RepID=UPI003B014E07
MSPHPYLGGSAPVPIAHRGGAALWPQNTMAAFEGAVALGYDHLETDVQATSDGVLAVFHDDSLDRIADRHGRICEMTWSEISAARVGGEPIPRLEELLDAFGEVRISIDPKSDAAVAPLIAALRRPGVLDRVCIGSFSEARLQRVHEAFGDAVCLSCSPREIARLRMLSLVPQRRQPQRTRPQLGAQPASQTMPRRRRTDRRRPFRGRVASIPLRQGPMPLATRRFVDCAHRLGIAVHVWTIDDPAEMDRLVSLGVDGVMTDEPAILLEVLARRGIQRPRGEPDT